jgi:hypothetical protein
MVFDDSGNEPSSFFVNREFELEWIGEHIKKRAAGRTIIETTGLAESRGGVQRDHIEIPGSREDARPGMTAL